jgi:hypothetical protein
VSPRRSPRAPLRAIALAGAVAASLAALPPLASAGAIDAGASSIARSAHVNAKGTALQLRGVVRCSACKSFTLGATVSQAGSGAIGQGGVRCVCHGPAERWVVTARTREATTFRAGTARVCVWITARGASGAAVDARQWCETVRLTFAGV